MVAGMIVRDLFHEDAMQNQNQTQGRQQGDNDDTKGLQQEGEARGDADDGSSKQDRNERVRRRQEEEQRRQRRDGGSPV
jgi:hypothetical protein